MESTKKTWWEKLAIIATITIALTGLARILMDITNPTTPTPKDTTAQEYAIQNAQLQQHLALMKRIDQMEKEQLKSSQQQLETKLAELTAQLKAKESEYNQDKQTAKSDTTTKQHTPQHERPIIKELIPDLNGVWQADGKTIEYTITQKSKYFTISEVSETNNGIITTAVGEGYVENNKVVATFTTIFNTTAEIEWQLSKDQSMMKGIIKETNNPLTTEIYLKRKK